jgi:hypothetical protein
MFRFLPDGSNVSDRLAGSSARLNCSTAKSKGWPRSIRERQIQIVGSVSPSFFVCSQHVIPMFWICDFGIGMDVY